MRNLAHNLCDFELKYEINKTKMKLKVMQEENPHKKKEKKNAKCNYVLFINI